MSVKYKATYPGVETVWLFMKDGSIKEFSVSSEEEEAQDWRDAFESEDYDDDDETGEDDEVYDLEDECGDEDCEYCEGEHLPENRNEPDTFLNYIFENEKVPSEENRRKADALLTSLLEKDLNDVKAPPLGQIYDALGRCRVKPGSIWYFSESWTDMDEQCLGKKVLVESVEKAVAGRGLNVYYYPGINSERGRLPIERFLEHFTLVLE